MQYRQFVTINGSRLHLQLIRVYRRVFTVGILIDIGNPHLMAYISSRSPAWISMKIEHPGGREAGLTSKPRSHPRGAFFPPFSSLELESVASTLTFVL